MTSICLCAVSAAPGLAWHINTPVFLFSGLRAVEPLTEEGLFGRGGNIKKMTTCEFAFLGDCWCFGLLVEANVSFPECSFLSLCVLYIPQGFC